MKLIIYLPCRPDFENAQIGQKHGQNGQMRAHGHRRDAQYCQLIRPSLGESIFRPDSDGTPEERASVLECGGFAPPS